MGGFWVVVCDGVVEFWVVVVVEVLVGGDWLEGFVELDLKIVFFVFFSFLFWFEIVFLSLLSFDNSLSRVLFFKFLVDLLVLGVMGGIMLVLSLYMMLWFV